MHLPAASVPTGVILTATGQTGVAPAAGIRTNVVGGGVVKEQVLWSIDADSIPPLEAPHALPDDVDVAVIGGGLTGLSAALRLARAGASVALFERETIGWGASGRNGGQVSVGAKRRPESWVREYGHEMAVALWSASVGSVAHVESLIEREGIDCHYRRVGLLAVAWRPEHFGHQAAHQKYMADTFGYHLELIPPLSLAAEIGSDGYHGALLDEFAGSLDPYRFTRGVAAAAQRAGAALFEGTEVTALTRIGGDHQVVTGRGTVRAAEVLVATNGYTGPVTPWLQRRLVPVGSHIIATEPLGRELAESCLPRRRVVYDTKKTLFYFTLSADDRMVFGGRASWTQVDAQRSGAIMHRHMVRLFPQLAMARIEYTWTGNVCFTRDFDPHIGYRDGCHFCAGYCGHGVALATYLGALVAGRLRGDGADSPFFHLKDPPPIPLYDGRPWFLPLAGGFYRAHDLLK